MQPEQTSAGEGVDAGAVARFLTANPEFFEQHRDVLTRLCIPHVSGRAVSLIERQVSVLRGKCASLEHRLRDLIGVAHANEQLQARLHELVQNVVSAETLDAVVAVTRDSLAESFGADAVHVLLVDAPAGDGHLVRASDDPALAPFAELLERGGTRCGLPLDAELDAFAEGARADIGSAALIPLRHEDTRGVVMLSCRDESRFAVGKGVVFLDQLGGVLSRRVHALRRVGVASSGADETPGTDVVSPEHDPADAALACASRSPS